MRLAVFRLGLFRVRQGLALVWAGRRSALGRQLSLSLRRSLLRLRCWLGDCDRRRWCFSHFFLRAPQAERQKDKAQGHDRLGSKWLHALLTESPAATRGCSPPAPLSESGSRRKKVVPCPSSEVNSTLPWCNCTTRYAMASPIPLPPFLVVKYRLKTLSRMSVGMPGPWSRIVIRAPSPSRRVTIRSLPPS